MACINPNTPEFKAALERTGNPLLAEIELDKPSIKPGVEEIDMSSPAVRMGLKSVNALQSDKAINLFKTLEKNKVKGDAFWNKIQSDLQIPKEQMDLLKQYNTTNREELIANMLGDYSYTVEIVTSTEKRVIPTRLKEFQTDWDEFKKGFEYNGQLFTQEFTEDGDRMYFKYSMNDYSKKQVIYEIEYLNAAEKVGVAGFQPTHVYANLTVPGGTNYTENEIATPLITPSIKGHAQFATDKGIGWFRSDDRMLNRDEKPIADSWTSINNPNNVVAQGTPTKTRRILEVQSDWGQKQRKSAEPNINIKYDIQQIINDLQKSGDLKIDCN